MSNEVDFEQFIKLLDGALASDDKNVKQALRKFLFVAAMVMGDDTEPGPFTKMMETMDAMQQRLAILETQQTPTQPQDWYGGSSPTFYPYISPGTGTAGDWTGGSITGTGTIPYTNTNTTTNAVSTTTTASNTGNITFSNTTGYSYIPSTTSGTSTITLDYTPKPVKTGTEIKDEIMEALDRLANVA